MPLVVTGFDRRRVQSSARGRAPGLGGVVVGPRAGAGGRTGVEEAPGVLLAPLAPLRAVGDAAGELGAVPEEPGVDDPDVAPPWLTTASGSAGPGLSEPGMRT